MLNKIKPALQGRMAIAESHISGLSDLMTVMDHSAFLDRYVQAAEIEGKTDFQPYSITEGGLAIINVEGTLVHKLGRIGGFFGIQGYDGLEVQTRLADADPMVKEIVYDLDSGGGQVDGLGECARIISEAKKPTTALVNECAASAAYWLACSCDHITAIAGSEVGSVGVLHIRQNRAGMYEKMGVEHLVFKAGEMKDEHLSHKKPSVAAQADIQAGVNETYERFVAWVSERRNLSAEIIKGTEARVYSAEKALELGLIDTITTKDDFINTPAIRGGVSQNGGFQMAKEEGRDKAAFTKAELDSAVEAAVVKAGEVAEAEKEAAVADGVKIAMAKRDEEAQADQERRTAIRALPEANGREALAGKLAEKGMSVDDAKEFLAVSGKSYSATMDEHGGADIAAQTETQSGEDLSNISARGM